MKKHIPLIKQIATFGVVGLVSLAIDVGISSILYVLCHFPAYLASATGFLSGFAFNFPMNRHKVFHQSSQSKFGLKTQVILYWLLVIFNLVTTSAIVEGIVSLGGTILVAKIIVTAAIAVWNFLIFKYFIFSKRASSASD